VPAGLHSGAVSTVNGSISVAANAQVTSASTVNGGIDIGAHASADSLTTVNGGVTLANGASVAHNVKTVNGTLNLGEAAQVGGSIINVNGHIVLTDAHVVQQIDTVTGDIDISGASHVDGGIHVHKSSGLFSFSGHRPRIVIGPGAVVSGPLQFDREVRLYVSDRATVGQISGASAVRFSGDQPQPSS
jgi:hypothetical protein